MLDAVIREELDRHARLAGGAATLGPDADLYRHGLTSHSTVDLMLALEDRLDVEFADSQLKKETFASISAIRNALLALGCTEEP